MQPLTTSWNHGMAFPWPFDTYGTDDYSAWFSLEAAVGFWTEAGGLALAERASTLLDKGAAAVAGALPPVDAPVPASAAPCLRLVPLPERRGHHDGGGGRGVRAAQRGRCRGPGDGVRRPGLPPALRGGLQRARRLRAARRGPPRSPQGARTANPGGAASLVRACATPRPPTTSTRNRRPVCAAGSPVAVCWRPPAVACSSRRMGGPRLPGALAAPTSALAGADRLSPADPGNTAVPRGPAQPLAALRRRR